MSDVPPQFPGFVPGDECATAGGGSDAPDTEQLILCDVDDTGNVVGVAIAVYNYVDGVPDGPPTFVDPETGDPYVPVGTLQPCDQPTQRDSEQEILCDEQPDSSVVRFIRTYVHDMDNGEILDSFDTLLDGNTPYAPTGEVVECTPEGLCTPSPARDLGAECGPGEDPDRQWIADQGQSPDARVDTDAAADGLCGGQWVRPETGQNAPFPVEESFRNATFDQPGPVTQGTAPYFTLTADPASHGQGSPAIPTDGAGDGWGRGSGVNPSFTNGLWQVPTPFPTTQGMTFETTFASHDGTTPIGGDGTIVGFTNGAVAAQGSAVGGGGNLGAANWEGGYVGVVMDEYGGLTGQANTIQIRGIGPNAGAGGLSPRLSVGPNRFNLTTRAQPLRLRVSIIEQFGQTFVSASINWNDGNGWVNYFDRHRVDDQVGAAPATLRMGINMSSGGAYRSVKEVRDAVANQGGVQWWRQYPITLNDGDPLDDCIETVDFEICVDHQFDSASQAAGDGEPEAWLWLINEATQEILAQTQWSSNPNTVGTERERCITFRDVDPVDVPNLRIVVGAETRDSGETFAHSWNNLRVIATGQGCPAEPVRTQLISAPCPIPVTIVGGGDGEGGGGAAAVFEAPSTLALAEICVVDSNGNSIPGLYKEVRSPDGDIQIQILGTNGQPIADFAEWNPGPCPASDTTDDECLEDDNGIFWRRVTVADDGTREVSFVDTDGNPYVPVGAFRPCDDEEPAVGWESICYTLDGGATILPGTKRHDDRFPPPGFLVFDADGNPVNTADPNYQQVVCDTTEGEIHVEVETLCDHGNLNPLGGPTVIGPTPFLRTYVFDRAGALTSTTDTELDGQTAYAPVGPVMDCDLYDTEVVQQVICTNGTTLLLIHARVYFGAQPIANSRTFLNYQNGQPVSPPPTEWDPGPCTPQGVPDVEAVEMCDGVGNTFLRHFVYSTDGLTVTASYDTDDDGTPFVAPGPVRVGACDTPGTRIDDECLTDDNGVFFRRTTVDDQGTITVSMVDVAGNAYVPVGTVEACGTMNARDVEQMVLCDEGTIVDGQPARFIRRMVFDAETGAFISQTDVDMGGAAFVPAGPVTACPEDGPPDAEFEVLCDHGNLNSLGGPTVIGPTPFLRRYMTDDVGTVVTTDWELDGQTAYAPVGPVFSCDNYGINVTDDLICRTADGVTLRMVRTRVAMGATTVATGTQFFEEGSLTAITPGPSDGEWTWGPCESCCPVQMGSGCWDDGQTSGEWVTFRDPDDGSVVGPVDTVTGNAVDVADIVDCPSASSIDRETVCWTTDAGGDTVFTGTIRHDDSLTGQPGTEFGWALFDQNQTQVPATEPGLTFVSCDTCCPEVIGEGCWDDGTSNGTWVSIRKSDGTVEVIDPTTGATVDPADVVDCPRPQYATFVRTVENATFVIPGGGTNLVSWSVRARTAGVDLTVGGTTVTMDQFETIESSTQDDTGTLIDAPTVQAAAGESARVTWLERA